MTAGPRALAIKTNEYYWLGYAIIGVIYETSGEEFIIYADLTGENRYYVGLKYAIDTNS